MYYRECLQVLSVRVFSRYYNNMDGKELLNVGGTQVTRAFIGVYVFFEMFFLPPNRGHAQVLFSGVFSNG